MRHPKPYQTIYAKDRNMPAAAATLHNHRKALDAIRQRHAAELPKGLRINDAGADPELYIYDDLGPSWAGMIDVDSVVRALKQLPANHKRVIVRINSPGGDVFEGFAIYNALARHPADIVVEVDGLAASAASIVAMAGDTIRMAANSMMMVHRAWTIAIGNGADLAKTVEVLNKVDENLAETYAARTGLDVEEIAVMLDEETWLQADEAVAKGFADEVGQELQVAASVPAGRFKNTPSRFLEALNPASPGKPADRTPPADPPAPPAPPSAGHAVRERLALARRRLGVG